ncbi:MAG: formate--tetrahydrofolate ligase [Sulfuricaulis sp.]|nr:formate--tetrahydrofolate ligase [Sulfuricaulis sp.]
MPADIDIAPKAKMQRIPKLTAEKLGIAEDHIDPYGHCKAKVSLAYVDSLKDKAEGKLILVTAISPAPPAAGNRSGRTR